MIKYTSEDVKALAAEISFFHQDEDLKGWLEIVDAVKKEYTEIKEIILELLGPCVFTFTREFSKKIGLTDLIFKIPLDMMPLYITKSDRPWEMVVARWRLSIHK